MLNYNPHLWNFCLFLSIKYSGKGNCSWKLGHHSCWINNFYHGKHL